MVLVLELELELRAGLDVPEMEIELPMLLLLLPPLVEQRQMCLLIKCRRFWRRPIFQELRF